MKRHPVTLLVGSPHATAFKARSTAQQVWCDRTCGVCRSCKAIIAGTWAGCVWLSGSQPLVKADVQPAITLLDMAHEQDPCVLVIERAERMGMATATQLLKLCEEPPSGAHIIFTCGSVQTLLEPLVSRCITEYVPDEQGMQGGTKNPWVSLLAQACHTKSPEFLTLLHDGDMTVQDIDDIARQVMTVLRDRILAQSADAQALHALLAWWYTQVDTPIPAGSEKIFLKSAYLMSMRYVCNSSQKFS